MGNILTTTAPIFILMILGFIAVRTKLVSEDGMVSMSKVVIYFTLPALIFSTLARMEFDEVIIPSYFFGYMIGSLIMLFGGLFLYSKVFKRPLSESTIRGVGMANSNSAFFAYPVMLLAFSNPPTAAFTMALIIENIVVLPVTFMILEFSSSQGGDRSTWSMLKATAKRLTKNPLIIAVTAGLVASNLHVDLPDTADRVLVMLSGASATLALIVLGGSLVGNSVKGNARDITIVTFGKLVLHPIAVGVMLFLMPGVDNTMILGGILIAAVPMMSIYPIIGSAYGQRAICASTLLVTTIASFFTLMVVLQVLSIQ